MKEYTKVLFLSIFLSCLAGAGMALDFSSFLTKGYEGKGELEFIMPEDLILGPAGEIVVADQKNNRVQVLRADGTFERCISAKDPTATASGPAVAKTAKEASKDADGEKANKNGLLNPVGLALDSTGKLYVTSSGNHAIFVFNFKNGAQVAKIGKPGRGQGELNTPLDIDVSAQGLLAIADSGNKRVQLMDSTGKFLREIHYKEETAKKELRSLMPKGVLWLPSGELLVSYPTFHQVVCWDINGNLLWRYGSKGTGKGELNEPSNLFPSRNGNLLISDSKNNRIVEITGTGIFVKVFSGRGTMPGRLMAPKGLALSKDDNLYIADQGNNRISIFKLGKTDLILREVRTLIDRDQWDEALPKIEQVINLDPNNTEARNLMVNTLHFFGDRCMRNFEFERAEEFFRRVLIYSPNDAEVQPKLDEIFWASNKDLIIRLVFGIVGFVAALILFWIAKLTFNRLVFGTVS